MRVRWAVSCLAVLLVTAPALAHHISGTVYCDQNGNGGIDVPGDTLVPGVTAVATSLDVSPGQQFVDGTNAGGFYYIGLPARTDRYRVELVGLPGGWSVVLPPGGAHVVQIITGTAQDSKENVNFLLQGCAATSTTTTTTIVPSTSTTTTTPASTTTTTTLFFCDCPATPFLVARDARLNNDATIGANVAANDAGGRVRLGKVVTMPDGTSVTADIVSLGGGASVSRVLANTLLLGPRAVARDGTGLPVLPVTDPFCTVPDIACGDMLIQVSPGTSLGPLAPGTYGRLRVMNGAALTLAPGEFTFCDIKMGRNATITTLGPATLNVAGSVIIGTASRLSPASGTAPVRVYTTGKAVRVSQSGVANAAFAAPRARISFGRDAFLLGCFCTDRAKSDKHITLACPAP